MALQVINSPFNQEQVELLNQLLPILTETQQIWLGGYLSASQLATQSKASDSVAVLEAPAKQIEVISKEVTILYGSQTGNGHALAEKLTKSLKAEEFQVTLASMNEFKPNALKKIENLLLIVSTHGEGDPPDNALPFYEFLHSKRAPQLDNLQFSVLSLGDSSYEFFCQTGKQFDERLLELGAKQFSPRVDCDLDYDESAAEWFTNVLATLNERQGISSTTAQQPVNNVVAEQLEYSRTNPFKAEILENLNLNGRGSNKETRHLELSLEGSNLEFEPGDSLGIYPENDTELVDTLIVEMGWNAGEVVSVNKQGEQKPLREALISNFEITVLTKPLLQKVAHFTANNELKALLEPEREQECRDYLYGRDLLDLVRDFAPWEAPLSEFIAILRKIPARLYSIASSSKANPDEVHLTIGTVRYEAHGRDRVGVCSDECAVRAQPGDHLAVYVQRNSNFKLPENPNTPLIMIGPGTGIAPFRSFLEEREEIGAEGKTWLFFGDQHFVTDFLYQVEWQQWLKEGVLTRMDVAFSRDTKDKVYVQHRMLENSKAIFEWLEKGAVLYVCGDEKHMAADVHSTLETILEKEGIMSSMEASDYLADMQQQKRYQRDVY
ncbi:assimilatory sulfite reductase (NADPH) flavoprotein subunit [Sporosarcina sp. ANT_H38]|uniref:assimilatory sulfite reductase (NADPH) flavoprotein subunit n=1 Tax=Sporosarcina sp. ANT_H38 TaxID=2597358 RepID=UPI0011F3CAD1|nr:assimilatory sulfite reductase (NADPH) flavoprotein subunit [Sporosarcina sp. ANT_H38]KAA0965934.1 assimilatory sulfite reductase (NADPH) flavoprotein subunit [Sporosarcina sp. ANT_H38]